MKNRMFPFITKTWNPLGGSCPHNCIYCWAKMLCKRHKYKKYEGKPRIIEKELKKKFKEDDFVFVQDMSDLFAENVSTRIILKVLDFIRESPARFLLLTKNPERYSRFIKDNEMPLNTILGATIESNKKFEEYYSISKAPPLNDRLYWFQNLVNHTSLPLFISIEPILDFYPVFHKNIKFCQPWAVAVGYDNYNHKLPEPPLEKTLELIDELEKFTTVHRKTLRKAWWE